MKINCLICNKEKDFRPALIKKGYGKFCSAKCMGISYKGKRHSLATEFKKGNSGVWLGRKRPDLINTNAAKTMFKKGFSPWNNGIVRPEVAGENSNFFIHGKSHTPEMKAFYQRNREYRKKANGGNHTYFQWIELKEKNDYTCLMCFKKEPAIKLTEDHIIPLILGGSNDISNIQPLCGLCNSRKGTKVVMFL